MVGWENLWTDLMVENKKKNKKNRNDVEDEGQRSEMNVSLNK